MAKQTIKERNIIRQKDLAKRGHTVSLQELIDEDEDYLENRIQGAKVLNNNNHRKKMSRIVDGSIVLS